MDKTDGVFSRPPLNECDSALVGAIHGLRADGSADEVRAAIDLGASIRLRDSDWNTVTHFAATCNNHEVMKVLCDKGADVSSENCEGDTPLHFAARQNHGEMVSTLLDLGSNIAVVNKLGETPLQSAIKTASTESVRRLIHRGAMANATIVDVTNEDVAPMKAEHHETVAVLLEEINRQNDLKFAGDHPWRQKGETVKALLSLELESQEVLVEQEHTLHSTGGSDNAELNKKRLEVLEALLKQINSLHFLDKETKTQEHGLLWDTVASNSFLGVRELLKIRKGDTRFINCVDGTPEKRTPLWAALSFGYLDIARLLLQAGADTEFPLENGMTMLLYFAGKWQIVDLLRVHGADMFVRDVHGNTLQHLAIQNGVHEVIAGLYADNLTLHRGEHLRKENGKLLSQIVNNEGDTLLHTAASWKQPGMISTLLDLHMDVDPRNNLENTPLLLAAIHDDLDSVAMLFEKGASHTVVNRFNVSLQDFTRNKAMEKLIGDELKRRNNLGM